MWQYVSGYDNSNQYTDDTVFEINKDDKTISKIKGQPLIAGERYSQYIAFQMARSYDGIDLSTKDITVLYVTELGFSDRNKVINVRVDENLIQFGWLVPPGACSQPGLLSFCIEFNGDDYVLKTIPTELEVIDSMNGSDIIAEPVEQEWYNEIQTLCKETQAIAQEVLDSLDTVLVQQKEKWRKVFDVTLTQSVSCFEQSVDDEGNPFRLKKARLITNVGGSKTDYFTDLGIDVVDCDYETAESLPGVIFFPDGDAFKSTAHLKDIEIEAKPYISGVLSVYETNYSEPEVMGTVISGSSYKSIFTGIDYIDFIRIGELNREKEMIKGSRFILWGVDDDDI